MYAVIETGGKQYRVAPGDTIVVETVPGQAGAAVEFDRVLAIGKDDGELITGQLVAGARVKGQIQSHGRHGKVIAFKFKRKKQYKRTIGHRQNFTSVRIAEIVA